MRLLKEKTMDFDGLIFDLDGTLWDCSNASAQAFNSAYEQFGSSRRVTEDIVRAMSGKPSSECDELLLAGVPDGDRAELSRTLDEYELQAIAEYAARSLYPGVVRGIEILSAQYKLLVVSNCGERYLEVFLHHTPIGSMFVDSESHGRTGKPKADNILAVIKRQGLLSACYIGDTEWDESAAAQAGIPFLHAAYGFGTPTGMPPSFSSFEELVRCLDNKTRKS